MEQLNDVLRYKKCVCREVKEHLMETQLHLPDYYPDICRILFCQVKPYAEHCSVENDRVVMDAVAEIRLLYCDADNRMQLFTSEVRYSKNAVLQKRSTMQWYSVLKMLLRQHTEPLDPGVWM